MNINYDYKIFLTEKILENLPAGFIKSGNRLNGRCPFCGDSKKSSTKRRAWLYLDKDCSFYCFNCSTGMSGIKFLQCITGKEYTDIKKEYVRLFLRSGLNIELSSTYQEPTDEPGLFELQSIIKPEWKKPLTDSAKQYLKNRMINTAPFLRDDIFSCYGKNDLEYILIPWITNGIDAYYQLNDFKKNGSIKYIFPKNKKKTVYGLDNIDLSWPYIIIFEGVYDSVFVKNGVAVGTKSISDYQLKLIKDRYPNHQICISFDNDKSGMESMSKAIKKYSDFKYFKWFNINTSAKDINEYVILKNDPNIFSKSKILEKLIITPLQMKMWLIQNNMLKIEKRNMKKM